MDRTALRQALIELLEKEIDIRPSNLDDSVSLRDGLGLDSMDLINLVMHVENRFEIRIETEELAAIQSVGNLLDLLQAKTASPPGAAAA